MKCTTCRAKPARSHQRTCAGCHAAYMRDYRKTARAVEVRKALGEGAEVMREKAVLRFSSIADLEMNGRTAAEIVRNL